MALTHSLVLITNLSIITLSISSITFKVNLATAQAVPLIPLTSGNSTLDKGIPEFYDCIEKKVKESKNTNDDPYFRSEPTKNEVFECYNSIFKASAGDKMS